jgi:hypothetical protein
LAPPPNSHPNAETPACVGNAYKKTEFNWTVREGVSKNNSGFLQILPQPTVSAEGWPYLHEHHNLSRLTLGVSFKKLAQRPFSEHQKKSPNKIKTPRRCRIDQLWHLFRR